MKVKLFAPVVAIGFFAAVAAFAAPPQPKSSIPPRRRGLAPPPAGPDYVPGADAAGNPVPPADLEAESPPPLPPEVVVPAGQSGAYVTLDRKALRQLVTPPSCGH